MNFFKNNKFIIITILVLSAFGYIFLYIQEQKSKNILIDVEEFQAEEKVEEIKEKVYIDIVGEIINPGVYALDKGSRVNDLIIIAGGVTEDADLDKINLAYQVSDGVKIIIPNKKDRISEQAIQSTLFNQTKNSVVNINQATSEELTSLPGVGESIADAIIDYRIEKGNFKNKDDIKNVSGIGESKYKKLKDKISI